MSAGALNRRIAVDAPVRTDNGAGGGRSGWTEAFQAWAEFRYLRGSEDDQAGGFSVTASFKLRLRSTPETRSITGGHRVRDLVTGQALNIREIDALSDRAFVWLEVQAGVAD